MKLTEIRRNYLKNYFLWDIIAYISNILFLFENNAFFIENKIYFLNVCFIFIYTKFKNRLKKKYLKYFKKIFFLFLHKNKKNINKKNINKKNINKKNINNLKKLNKKSIYLLNKLDKGYFNIIYCNNYSKYINFKF